MPAPIRIDELLRDTALLRDASPSTIDTLAGAARVRTLARAEVLYVAGDRPTAVHAVASGMLRVFTTSFDGDEPTINVLAPGAVLGELGVIEAAPRSASVAALRKSEVIEIPAPAFLAAYATDGSIARHLVGALAARVRALSDGVTDLAHLDLGGRLAKYLVAELDRQRARTITLPLSQGEIGGLIGGARQTVNQLLRALSDAGMIAVDGRHVRVLDEGALRGRAAGVT